MTQASLLATASDVQYQNFLPQISYKEHRVMTTDALAQAYGCSVIQIQQNFLNNKERFIEGKHYFLVKGKELKDFRLQLENFEVQISPKTRHLLLYPERGAARHAKMLNTDKAWDVFEMLEETFFRVVNPQPEPPALDATTRLSRRTDAERKALTAILNTWVGLAPVHYASARMQVNAHFGVASVDDLTIGQVKEAIMWVQGKIDALPVALPEAPVPAPPPARPTSVADLRARCDELRSAMWKAGDINRDLWRMVRAYTDVINREKGIYGSHRHSLLVSLHDTCTAAFNAWEHEADAIAHSVKAMRILAEDMR